MTESKILSMDFQKEWNTPQGRIMKIYNVQLEDGTSGTCYLQDPVTFQEGDTVNYEISNGKIKMYEPARTNTSSNSHSSGSQGSHQLTYYLGYAYGYAKDISIAEMEQSTAKTKKVSEKRLKELAETIYSHMGELFNKGSE